MVTVPGIEQYNVETACEAHPEGGDSITKYEEVFGTNITNLIVKWEELGGGGRKSDWKEEEFGVYSKTQCL